MATFTQDNRLLKLTTPLGPDVLLIRSFSCSERISGLYSIQVSCAATPENARQVKAEDLIGQPAVISVAAFEGARFFHGVVKRFAAVGKDNDFFYYSLEIVPWFWLLSQRTDCRIFQELTVPAIVEQILVEIGCPAFKLKLDNAYTVWYYFVQYR